MKIWESKKHFKVIKELKSYYSNDRVNNKSVSFEYANVMSVLTQ